MAEEISTTSLTEEIKKILKTNDLLKITPKLVRENLETLFECDLTSRKTVIDQIIVDELERINCESNKEDGTTDDDADDLADGVVNGKKATKLTDEQLAEIIHSEETRNQRSKRSTTAAATVCIEFREIQSILFKSFCLVSKEASSKKKKRTRSGSVKNESAPKRQTAFTKDVHLSPALCEIIGKMYCSRSEVVKTMWKYFKDNNLIDPKNKQYVLCDDKLEKLFLKKKFKAFGMMKDLKKHIHDIPAELTN
jgi:upstream activation factor subunit UAF30